MTAAAYPLDIIIIGTIAEEATAALTKANAHALRQRFPSSFIARMVNVEEAMSEGRAPQLDDAKAIYTAGEESILSALWHFAEILNCGITIQTDTLPIKQETIEICEFLGINPYDLPAGNNCIIAAVPSALQTINSLSNAGLRPASVVGSTSPHSAARILVRKDRTTYLTPPERNWASPGNP